MNKRVEFIAEQMAAGETLGEAMRLADQAGFGRSVPTGIEAAVCEDITQRQQHGVNKYGRTVADNPLNLYQWMQQAYEESLDFSVYLKRAMSELAKSQSFTISGIKHLSGEVLLATDFDENVSEHLAAGDQVVLLVLKKAG